MKANHGAWYYSQWSGANFQRIGKKRKRVEYCHLRDKIYTKLHKCSTKNNKINYHKLNIHIINCKKKVHVDLDVLLSLLHFQLLFNYITSQ